MRLIEREGTWERQGWPQRIFDGLITNDKYSHCSFSGTLHASVFLPPSAFITKTWGYNHNNGEIINVLETAPGQTYTGFGFILSGMFFTFERNIISSY